jgi:nucleoid-associated protein YgaU
MAIRYYRCRQGDTLEKISEKVYGDKQYATFIYKHNDHIISDPNHLNPGQALVIPHIWKVTD